MNNDEKAYEKHLGQIKLFKPVSRQHTTHYPLFKHSLIFAYKVIEFTSLSKLASNLKETANEDLKSAINLSIDDFLNTRTNQNHSLSLEQMMNKQAAQQQPPRRPAFARTKSMLTRPNSICLTDSAASSFEDTASSSSTSGYLDEISSSSSQSQSQQPDTYDHKLKVLESNFNQIAIGHHSDETLIDMCLDKYSERFFKADSYLSYLFDDLGNFLNKVVNCLNELDHVEPCPPPTLQQDMEMLLDCADLPADEPAAESVFALPKTKKKFLQENLNSLNKTIALARKSMIDLVITSTTIGGLKQVIIP